MPVHRDCRGLPVTVAGAAALREFDAAVAAWLGLRLDTGDRLKAALAADPEFPLAHVLRGYFMLLFANRALLGRARASLEAARAACEKHGADARERAHLAALDAWIRGRLRDALACWAAVLDEAPLDVVAVKLSEYWHFYRGDAAAMREAQSRVAPFWAESVPDYGKVLGMSAFALEECGEYAEAESRGRRAVEIDPADLWSCHAVAHVFEMTGRRREGIAWIDGLAGNFAACNAMANHVWWHRALFHFDLGLFDETLALYDSQIRPENAVEYLDICNAASLLWRLEEEGVDVGGRWEALAGHAASRAGDFQLVFADVHYAMALAAAGRMAEFDALAGAAEALARDPGDDAGEVMAEAGLPVVRAVGALRAGDWGRAVDLLHPRRRSFRALGGSNAQRDLFDRMLIHAAGRAGRRGLAAALRAERSAHRSAPQAGTVPG